jgi:predicted transcriptional regulator of viral defense system
LNASAQSAPVPGRQSDNVRAKLKRLEDRGWLRRTASGRFAIAP